MASTSEIPLTTPGNDIEPAVEEAPPQVEAAVYFEEQERTQLKCGRHCLNNLLQGSYYSDEEFVGFAREMDRAELDLMSPEESVNHIGTENADEKGNYSFQVIERALKLYDCEPHSISTAQMGTALTNPENQEAFLVHEDDHWYAIRKVNGVWYNLNSLPLTADIAAQPFRVTEFYLSAILRTLIDSQKAVFVVTGNFPTLGRRARHSGHIKGSWYHPNDIPTQKQINEQIERAKEEQRQRAAARQHSYSQPIPKPLGNALPRVPMSVDEEMERARVLSRQEHERHMQETNSATEMDPQDFEEKQDVLPDGVTPSSDLSSSPPVELPSAPTSPVETSIYFESQVYGTYTCGRHCLNNLLQGAYYTDYEFKEFAKQMDIAERALMGPDENTRHIGGENADAWGNYSVQVMARALELYGLAVEPLASEAMAAVQTNPETQNAFLVNEGNHWYAIRKVNGIFYNLNSLPSVHGAPSQPYVISEFYLGAYLTFLRDSGLAVFVVIGTFPTMGRTAPHTGDVSGSWYHPGDIKTRRDIEKSVEASQKAARTHAYSSPSYSTYSYNRYPYSNGATRYRRETELEKAQRLSLQEEQRRKQELQRNGNTNANNGDDEELNLALAMSASLSMEGNNNN